MEPRPEVTSEVVSVDGKQVLVIDIPRGPDFPYLVRNVAMLRRDDDVTPLTSLDVVEVAAQRGQSTSAKHLAEISERQRKIERRLRWTRQLPIRAGCTVGGVLLAYVLSRIEPFKDLLP